MAELMRTPVTEMKQGPTHQPGPGKKTGSTSTKAICPPPGMQQDGVCLFFLVPAALVNPHESPSPASKTSQATGVNFPCTCSTYPSLGVSISCACI